MYCYYQNMYQCPFMRSRAFNPQEFGSPYYSQFYNRQQDAGLELVEEVPPSGVFADVDPDFARKAARRCRKLGSVARLGVELENGERLTLRNFETGRNSLTGIDVTTGLDEIIDYKSIARIRCMRARPRSGNPYEYDYEYCDCEEEQHNSNNQRNKSIFYRFPAWHFQCCYPYENEFENLERVSQGSKNPWPTEGQESKSQWPTESQGPAQGQETTEDEWTQTFDAKKYCKEHCTAMSYNEKVRIADSCQGYEVFMCFYGGYEEFAGYWKINGVHKQNNIHYVSVENTQGVGELFDIRSIKCLSSCR